MKRITFIPGDGTGPDVSHAAKRCIEATGFEVEWETFEAGEEAIEKYNTPLPPPLLSSIKKNKLALKGPITTPVGKGFRSVNVALRQVLNLYACVRPCKLYKGIRSSYRDIDIIIIRENTEDLYAGIEFERGKNDTREIIEEITKLKGVKIRDGSGISIKPISEFGTRRIVNFAFEYALKHRRKKVTCVHKANIMKYTDGLFLDIARDVAKSYEDRILFEDRLVDNLCMQLVRNPSEFDVIVLPNLYGDIVSDLCAGLVGGLGVAPGANIGDEVAVFEPTHGSAPKYKGLDKVNPTAAILSGVLMLKHIGEEDKADFLERAVEEVIAESKKVTYDLKEDKRDPTSAKCSEMTDEIIKKIRNKLS